MQLQNFIQMYFDPTIARDFAEHEQNEKNFKVAEIIDAVIMQTIWSITPDFHAAELGGWAHPDRYHHFFRELARNKWHIDRVDISPYMLELAKEYIDTDEYRDRLAVITFVEDDILSYLEWIHDNSLDLAIMKYTIDYIQDIDVFFRVLQQKLKKWAALVSSIWVLSPQLKSISTNARFLYNWEEFPESETRILQDGQTFTVKFFNVSGKPEFWYIPWGETTKFYHSKDKYEETAKRYWFEIFVWDRKEIIPQHTHDLNQDVLVLKK